jgi:hypothetical protein
MAAGEEAAEGEPDGLVFAEKDGIETGQDIIDQDVHLKGQASTLEEGLYMEPWERIRAGGCSPRLPGEEGLLTLRARRP